MQPRNHSSPTSPERHPSPKIAAIWRMRSKNANVPHTLAQGLMASNPTVFGLPVTAKPASAYRTVQNPIAPAAEIMFRAPYKPPYAPSSQPSPMAQMVMREFDYPDSDALQENYSEYLGSVSPATTGAEQTDQSAADQAASMPADTMTDLGIEARRLLEQIWSEPDAA